MKVQDIKRIIRLYKGHCTYRDIANWIGAQESSVIWIIEQYKAGKIKE